MHGGEETWGIEGASKRARNTQEVGVERKTGRSCRQRQKSVLFATVTGSGTPSESTVNS
jgi:hypothetical protein